MSEIISNEELKNRIQEAIKSANVEAMPESEFKDLKGFERLFDEVNHSHFFKWE